MRKLVVALAIAAVGGLTSLAASGSAAPAVGGLALGGAVALVDDDGLVQNVQARTSVTRSAGTSRPAATARDRYDYENPYDPRRRPRFGYSRYHGPLSGPDLYPYFRLRLGKDGWGRGGR